MGKGETFIIVIVIQLLTMNGNGDCSCTFNGQTYAIGETWHPPTFESCVNCSCELTEMGVSEVTCVNKADECPKLTCPIQRKDPNTCCPYCEDLPNIPPTVRGGTDESSSGNRASCSTPDGRVYKDGDHYPSNSTGIKPTSNQQCVMCVCQDGQSLCHLKTCQVPKGCSSFITEPEKHCCPVCADCAHADGLKKNGSSWHPTVSDFGEIECITCTCVDGVISCNKNCVPDHELPCPHPRKPNGECCKTCPIGGVHGQIQPDGSVEGIGAVEEKENSRKNERDRRRRRRRRYCKKEKNKNKKRCRKRGRKKDRKDRKDRKNRKDRNDRKSRRRKQRMTTPLSLRMTTAPPTGVDLANLCLKRKRKYLVYKAITDSELLIAFDDILGGTVDVYKWKINKENQRGVISYTEPQVVSAVEFRKTINNTNVVGTTGKKHYRKFKKRLKQKLEQCNSDCQPESFVKILQRVKVHLLKFGEECKT